MQHHPSLPAELSEQHLITLTDLIRQHDFPGPFIETFTGHWFHFLNPEHYFTHTPPADILTDIATSLSRECRFGNHTKITWSVAQHSVYVYLHLKSRSSALGSKSDDTLLLAALLHDAHEAYVRDIPSPFKKLLNPTYSAISALAQHFIHEHFNVGYLTLDQEEELCRADIACIKTEAAVFMKNSHRWTEESFSEENFFEPPASRTLVPFAEAEHSIMVELYKKLLKQFIM